MNCQLSHPAWISKGKNTNCSLLSAHYFTFSCNHSAPLSLSLSECVSLLASVSLFFLIGVQHPPTSCQKRAPAWSSKPSNYCLGKLTPRAPSQTSRTSQRALPRPCGDGEGKAGQTPGWSPLPLPSPILCHVFYLMDLTNMNSSQPQGLKGSGGGGGRGRGDAPKRGWEQEMDEQHRTKRVQCVCED